MAGKNVQRRVAEACVPVAAVALHGQLEDAEGAVDQSRELMRWQHARKLGETDEVEEQDRRGARLTRLQPYLAPAEHTSFGHAGQRIEVGEQAGNEIDAGHGGCSYLITSVVSP